MAKKNQVKMTKTKIRPLDLLHRSWVYPLHRWKWQKLRSRSSFHSYVPGTSSQLSRDHDPVLEPNVPKRYNPLRTENLKLSIHVPRSYVPGTFVTVVVVSERPSCTAAHEMCWQVCLLFMYCSCTIYGKSFYLLSSHTELVELVL
jgi:hypothetical protein